MADAKQIENQATKLMARHKSAVERYGRLATGLSWAACWTEVTGSDPGHGPVSRIARRSNGRGLATRRPAQQSPREGSLSRAGERFTRGCSGGFRAPNRVFLFNLAEQVERERLQGATPTQEARELLATAVERLGEGEKRLTPKPDLALRVWEARDVALHTSGSMISTRRNEVLGPSRRTADPDRRIGSGHFAAAAGPAGRFRGRLGTPVPAGNGIPPVSFKRTRHSSRPGDIRRASRTS